MLWGHTGAKELGEPSDLPGLQLPPRKHQGFESDEALPASGSSGS